VAAVAKTMAEHDELLADIRARLEQARAVYKSFYDKHHRNVRYAVGDGYSFAFDIVPQRPYMWSPRGSYGPYRVAAIINDVAYRLELPPRTRLHDVFHVGLLKKFVGTPPAAPLALPPTHHGAMQPVPERATQTRLARGGARCWSIGKVSLQLQPLGRTSTASSTVIQASSSRTSCSSREGEM
jgi:hypothetical protein